MYAAFMKRHDHSAIFQMFSHTGLSEQTETVPSYILLIDTVLRGLGQVMLQNNSYTGLLFLIGIFYHSVLLGCAAILGTVTSTLTAILLGADRADIRAGLFGFNGALTAIALLYFLEPFWISWGYVILATAFSSIMMSAMLNCMSTWRLPTLTAPFVLTTLLFILACARFGQLQVTGLLPSAGLPNIHTEVEGIVTLSTLLQGTLNGIAQVFFQSNSITGLFFLLGLFINSRTACMAALFGSLFGVCIAWCMGVSEPAIRAGAFGFNNVLTALVFFGGLFVLNRSSLLYGLLAVTVTSFIYAALSASLEPLGMPAMTSAFIITVWLFILAAPQFSRLNLISPS